MLDLDTIPVMFGALEGCLDFTRSENLGVVLNPRFSDPHKEADQWLQATPERRAALTVICSVRLAERVRRLAQEARERFQSTRDLIYKWRCKNPDKIRDIEKRSKSKNAEKNKVTRAAWTKKNIDKIRKQTRERAYLYRSRC